MLTGITFIGFVISPLFRKMGSMHETLNLQEIKKTNFQETILPYCKWTVWAVRWVLCHCGEEKLDCSVTQYRRAGPVMQ